MTTKKKMAIAFSAMGAVCLAAVIGFVAVLAATTGYVKHGVNISYTASDFIGSVSMTSTKNLSTWTDATTQNFNGTEQDGAPALDITGTTETLSKTSQYIVFQYVIENTSAQYAYTATLTYTDDSTLEDEAKGAEDKNEILLVKSSTTDSASTLTFNRDSLSTDWGTADTTTVTVPAKSGETNGKAWIYVLVAIDNLADDFSLSGNFNISIERATTA